VGQVCEAHVGMLDDILNDLGYFFGKILDVDLTYKTKYGSNME
jgi:hypothetical protein